MSPSPEPPFESQPPAISLDALAAAFAQAMGTAPGDTPPKEEAAEESGFCLSSVVDEESIAAEAEVVLEPQADDSCPLSPRSLLEAMLFVGNRDGQPLAPQHAADLMRGVAAGEIAGLVDELNDRYDRGGCPYAIISEGSGYRMTLRPTWHTLRDRFHGRTREAKLSRAAVDCLAIVAYQQPISVEQVSRFRGRPAGPVLTQLVHRGLLKIERAGGGRHVAEYGTTERFLRLFGLESLDDLPRD